ncbi:S8 family serine peptidase [Streptomyces griseiscabiei]|uniref:S8 family serine peptidase n=2 Tax=Streptomyces griseiscabiei TaxID=2993540 RepID=A0ABU4L5J6_9ACTN|nr:S8 family serine peptidase [Streptomyces griseiscabiei]MBZ3901851.1 S8 family serine peptidase [Streptomyces griseiscabiei]MDX2910949.1 S8 family serine peptidase [Streptomyces griseiscabiei]
MPRPRRAAGCLVLLTLTLSVLPGQAPSAATPLPASLPASTSPASAAPWQPGSGAAPAQAVRTVTLLTGDQVALAETGAGDTVTVTPGEGRERLAFTRYEDSGHQYVVPDDALALVASGALDRRLFDTTRLADAGYDSAHGVPLIVKYRTGEGSSARLRAGVREAGARVARTLPGLRLTAVRAAGDAVTPLWEELTERDARSGERELAADVARIWLDAELTVSDDVSVRQIGAPAAWEAGYTGTGVKVAVLDTGVDDTHPDIAARVVEKENFTTAPDTTDLVGHGTHVASIVAGDGAASDGRYTGVAPGADLLVGKVCVDRGCEESAILAGMEWAAPRARVVNMSLSGPDSPGTDPLEEAVGTLSAKFGTLFAVAAGNTGRDQDVRSPASADAALAVGAVDAEDALTDFSSRGPRVGDGAIKPDITAPGAAIVAARSKDSDLEPVDGDPAYAPLSGTSMATPHVAGAAALLAQRHPDWTGERLKDALMGSAKPTPGLSVHAQGAGRVDVARAVGQDVTVSPPSLSLGTSSWPHDDDPPLTRTVTYRNSGPADLTLDLTTTATGPDGKAAPEGLFTVAPARLTVPAGGSAEAVLTADTRVDSVTGLFTGAVLARAGDTTVRSVLAATKAHETHPLTVKVLDRHGEPAAGSFVNVLDIDRGEGRYVYGPQGTGTVEVRPGRHHLDVHVATAAPDGSYDHTVVALPLKRITGPETVVLDAREGRPVTVDPPRKGATSALAAVSLLRTTPSGAGVSSLVSAGSFARLQTADLSAGKGRLPADAGALTTVVRSSWAKQGADGTFTDTPYDYELAWVVRGRMPTDFHGRARRGDLTKVTHTFYADRPDEPTAALRTYAFPPEGGSAVGPNIKFRATGKRTVHYSARGLAWTLVYNRLNALGQGEFQQWGAPVTFRAGGKDDLRWGHGPLGPSFADRRGLTYGSVRRQGDTLMFHTPPFADQDPGHTGFSLGDSGRTRLWREGKLLADVPYPFYDAQGPVPAAEASYRLETAVDRGGQGYLTSTSVKAAWTFRSGHTEGGRWTALPVTAIRFTPDLRLDNSARAGHRMTLPVVLRRQPGAPESAVRELSVEVSYDDGATWTAVDVRRTGNPERWRAELRNPRSGFASLRAKSVDADGGTAAYTVIRAYRLR